MKDLITRLLMIIEKKKITQHKFAIMAGISPANFLRMLQGKQNITERTIDKICTGHGLNKDWLLTGEGDMFTGTHIEQHHNQAAAIGGDAITTDARTVEALIKMVETRDRQLEKSQQQIDRLITLLEQQK